MGYLNRGSKSGFGKRGFDNRGSRGPVQMHQATCDKCRKECQVPFRPTNGKPVFCSVCFESNSGFDSRRSEGRSFDRPTNFEEKRVFEAVCDECGNACKVPFRPSGDKPVYCSNCFGEKKGAGNKENVQCQSQCTEQFKELNIKLDRILKLLDPEIILEVQKEPDLKPEEQVVAVEETKEVKKKSPKKK